MFETIFSFIRPAVVLVFAVGVVLSSPSAALAQAASNYNPWHDTSRAPFKIKLSGFINTRPEAQSTAVVRLGISGYTETPQLEVITVEAVDNPQVGAGTILQQVGKHRVDFNLIGPKELRSKVSEAEPGTPLAIVGFFEQRTRNLLLESVEVIGMTN